MKESTLIKKLRRYNSFKLADIERDVEMASTTLSQVLAGHRKLPKEKEEPIKEAMKKRGFN